MNTIAQLTNTQDVDAYIRTIGPLVGKLTVAALLIGREDRIDRSYEHACVLAFTACKDIQHARRDDRRRADLLPHVRTSMEVLEGVCLLPKLGLDTISKSRARGQLKMFTEAYWQLLFVLSDDRVMDRFTKLAGGTLLDVGLGLQRLFATDQGSSKGGTIRGK